MPHDKNGRLLEPGDVVAVLFKVINVMSNDDYCNVNLESVEGMPPSGHKTNLSAINTRQTIKLAPFVQGSLAATLDTSEGAVLFDGFAG